MEWRLCDLENLIKGYIEYLSWALVLKQTILEHANIVLV